MTTRQGEHARRLTINGARLHVRDRGTGPAIVFIHGGLGAGSEWDAISAELAPRHRVITFDSRGHGQSDNPAGVLSYPQLADDTAALITALGLVAPTVVGWSDGGQVALELSVRQPDTVGALWRTFATGRCSATNSGGHPVCTSSANIGTVMIDGPWHSPDVLQSPSPLT